jgi:hypothetical protein
VTYPEVVGVEEKILVKCCSEGCPDKCEVAGMAVKISLTSICRECDWGTTEITAYPLLSCTRILQDLEFDLCSIFKGIGCYWYLGRGGVVYSSRHWIKATRCNIVYGGREEE